MKRSDAFPTSYMSKDDVQTPLLLRISDVQIKNVGTDSEQEEKPVMYFKEPEVKPMILNQTNWSVLEALYGEDTDSWRGKPIVIYFDQAVLFKGKRVGGVRCRAPKPGSVPIPAENHATDDVSF